MCKKVKGLNSSLASNSLSVYASKDLEDTKATLSLLGLTALNGFTMAIITSYFSSQLLEFIIKFND